MVSFRAGLTINDHFTVPLPSSIAVLIQRYPLVRPGFNISYGLTNDSLVTSRAFTLLDTLYSSSDSNSPRNTQFTPSMVFVSTWKNVEYLTFGDSRYNTFKVVLISDGKISYALFLFAELQWGHEATVGFQSTLSGQTVAFNNEYSGTRNTINMHHYSNVGVRGVFVYRVDGKYDFHNKTSNKYIKFQEKKLLNLSKIILESQQEVDIATSPGISFIALISLLQPILVLLVQLKLMAAVHMLVIMTYALMFLLQM